MRDMMDIMQRALQRWAPHIEKITKSELKFVNNGVTFTVTATWLPSRAGPAGALHMLFDRQRVLGATATSPPLQQRPVKRTCAFRDDIIQEILTARGVR